MKPVCNVKTGVLMMPDIIDRYCYYRIVPDFSSLMPQIKIFYLDMNDL